MIASDIVLDAALAANVVGLEQSLSGADQTYILRRLNGLIDLWSNQPAAGFSRYGEPLTLTPGTAGYSTSLFANGRPTLYVDCYLTLSNVSYPIEFIDVKTYGEIPVKTTAGLPVICYVDTEMPNNTMYFYPVPSMAYTANFTLQKQLTGTLVPATTISVPAGYYYALVANLALDLCVPYKKQPDALLIDQASKGLAWIKRTNSSARMLDMDWDFQDQYGNQYILQRGW